MALTGWLRKTLSGIGLPIWMGQAIAAVPYPIRPGLGSIYKRSTSRIHEFEEMELLQKKDWIFTLVKNLTGYAQREIPFYRDHYQKSGFDSTTLRSFDDLQRIPIINKTLLLNYSLEDRSNLSRSGYLVNTGGTSGTPLDLYIHSDHLGNEWAHMHQIWSKRGFHPRELKLMLTGRSEFKEGLYYDFLRHSISISIYSEIDQFAPRLTELIKRYQPKFIHGYPSAIYEFALACRKSHPELLELMRNSLQAGFLGSEYPTEHYRQTAEDLLGISTISWYGHTERCILAYEKTEPLLYYPFQSYGYTEALPAGGGEMTLIGTGYFNMSSPLIRYDTEDRLMDASSEDGLLTHFRIKEGRKGEFILDKNGKKIPLTGLIFGRHHGLFNHCSHLQIRQSQPGSATVIYVPIDAKNFSDPGELFDSRNVNIDFDFLMRTEPIRTAAGKVKLVVEDDLYLEQTSV